MTDLTSSVVRNEKGASRRTKEDLNIKFKKTLSRLWKR